MRIPTPPSSSFARAAVPDAKATALSGGQDASMHPWLIALILVGAVLVFLTFGYVFIEGGHGVRRFAQWHATSRGAVVGAALAVPRGQSSYTHRSYQGGSLPPTYRLNSNLAMSVTPTPRSPVVPIHAVLQPSGDQCGAKANAVSHDQI